MHSLSHNSRSNLKVIKTSNSVKYTRYRPKKSKLNNCKEMAPFKAQQASNRRARYTAPRRKLNLAPSAVERLPANQGSFQFKTKMMFSVEGLESGRPKFSGDHNGKERFQPKKKCNSDSSVGERGNRGGSQRRRQEAIASNSSDSYMNGHKSKQGVKARERKVKKFRAESASQKSRNNVVGEKKKVIPDFGDYNKAPIKRLSYSKTEIVSNYDRATESKCNETLISFKSFRAGGVYKKKLKETYSQISSSSQSLQHFKCPERKSDHKRTRENDGETNTVVKTSYFSIHNKHTSLKLPFQLREHEKISFGSQAVSAKSSRANSEVKSKPCISNKCSKNEPLRDLKTKENRSAKSKIKASTPTLKPSAVKKPVKVENSCAKSQRSSEYKRSVSMNLADVSEISSEEVIRQPEKPKQKVKLWTRGLEKGLFSEKMGFLAKSHKYVGVVLAHSALLCLLLAKAKVINVDKISRFFVKNVQESPLLEAPLSKFGETLYSLNVEALNIPKPFK